jgi:response regulator RpfG family c-di-GMP phosphodiesterase
MNEPTSFIIIDDDNLNNMLCQVLIKRLTDKVDILTFNLPRKGFEYILTEYSNHKKKTVLFLDINMPDWTGWIFLENFERLDDSIKQCFKIYMLSSSIDPNDENRAKSNENVVDFIVKPLTKNIVLSILSEVTI